jgi:Na+-translocating ferredoxin:NAD+ oxidoreductase RnfD subunit
MGVHAVQAPNGRALRVAGRSYPVLLPRLSDPRLHLAVTITSLQVIGQLGFHFQLSIAQILLSVGTCAALEMAIAFRSQRVILWPASAMLTGNGVAFILRVPGTAHGDWWSLNGWWIFVAASAVSLLSKHVIRWRGSHVFNPSNIGLVVCFLALGRNRAAPLDFWWGPMSAWLVLALVVIVSGGFAILWRLKLLRVALGFWAAFAAGIGVLALAGHTMTARWTLGPISGLHLWWLLITSPEVLVFLFFMITDPKTAPRSPSGRLVYAVSLGLLASVLIAPTTTEFAAKVALLVALAIVCVAMPVLRLFPFAVDRRLVLSVSAAAVAACAAALVLSNPSAGATAFRPLPPGTLPPITILPSRGVQTQLDMHTAELIAHDLLAVTPASTQDTLRIWLEQGQGQGPPTATAQLANLTYHLHQVGNGEWSLGSVAQPRQAMGPRSSALDGLHLTNVASSVGLDFRQDSFRYGVSNEAQAMMGGGVCWLDYNNDGWEDLFAVNSYSSADTARWQASGGLPRTALYENVHGTFRNVGRAAHADLPVQGDGCVAADLNGDGYTDLVVTTTTGIDLLWNNGNGTFTQGARAAGMTASGWYTGVAVADVNGDGRPDVFVAGYTAPNDPVPNSLAGFPTNLAGVRDLLYLNEGNDASGRARFREVGIQAGLESVAPRHGLGAQFLDVNGDGRPDLYVANDEDPNQLYVNVPWPGGAQADPEGLGFRFEERGAAAGVADPYAGMGVASSTTATGGVDLIVTNSRDEPTAAFRRTAASSTFASARHAFDPALGNGFAGWGVSWVDLANSGTPDLVLAAGAIPVTSLGGDAEPVRVLAPAAAPAATFGDASSVLGGTLKLNGRGVAAADVDNDGRMAVAINTIGGKLVLLQPSGRVGHWLDVRLSRFAPGAVVTVTLPDGRRLTRTVQAGGSYLSSEDQRVHFGLGAATSVRSLSVRYPWGGESFRRNVAVNRVVGIASPPPVRAADATAGTPALANCTPAPREGRSVARIWNDEAVDVLRLGGASEPVQARDLFDLSAAISQAWHGTSGQENRETAISYAAYRLLVWRASYGANLDRAFALLTGQLRGLCLSPDFTRASGDSPAELGNRIGAAAIAAGRHDGSNEAFHYADASYTPVNGPLVVAAGGSTVHDPTFWQPLALSLKAAQGGGSVPSDVQTFENSQWGRVRTFAARVDVRSPPLGDPTSVAYKQAAVAAIRAASRVVAPSLVDASPLGWNRVAASLPAGPSAAARLAHDVRLDLALNGALNDAAVSAWEAKRRYQSPRPISMIRYLAFNNQLPTVPGLIKRVNGTEFVLRAGRWMSGARWSPLAPTPPSPGWVSGGSAFAYAADEVLTAFAGRSFSGQAARAASEGVERGTELRVDVTAGRTLGTKVGKLALRKLAG